MVNGTPVFHVIFSHILLRFLMGRDKSRAHLHLSHRIDPNVEQQLEALRQKLAEVSVTFDLSVFLWNLRREDHFLKT